MDTFTGKQSIHLVAVVGGIALIFLAVGALAQDHPNQSRGLTGGTFETGSIDQVNLFNGGLSLVIPLGNSYPVGGGLSYGLTLTYSSNIWLYQGRVDDGGAGIEAIPNPIFNAGVGWRLSLGQLYPPSRAPVNTSDQWMYVGPDGGAHHFYQQLHDGENDDSTDTLYTRDGSYLRLKRLNKYVQKLESPSGQIHTFTRIGCEGCWFLTRIEDRFGNYLKIAYNSDKSLWTLTDRHDRTHYVRLTTANWIGKRITEVDLEAFGGQRAIHRFVYRTEKRRRSCKDTYPSNKVTIKVPLLTRLELPDGSSYEVLDPGGTARYHNGCDPKDVPGVIKGIRLPTRGEVEWTFKKVTFPPANSPFDSSAGVSERRIRRRDGVVKGTWRYKRILHKPDDGPKNELITQVVYPTGDCSKHFFSAPPKLTNSPKRGWEYGLPFTWRFEDGGRYLSSEIWASNLGGTTCDGEKPLRSVYFSFAHDPLPGSTNDVQKPHWYNSNRRLTGQRTRFHDDGDRWTDTELTNFDGLGHYRTVEMTGNFWQGSANNERRAVFTHFNPTRGTYPGSYVPVTLEEPWILGTYSEVLVAEGDAHGEIETKVRTVFDPATGALTCQRVMASGLARGPQDLVNVFERNSWGLLTDAKSYGGDLQPLATTGEGCGDLPAEPEYWTHHTNNDGVRTSSRPTDPDGTPGPFLTYDVNVDPSTGLVVAGRDPGGLETTFDYDQMGRIKTIQPPVGAEAILIYSPATAEEPAKLAARLVDDAEILIEAETVLDAFGQPWVERRKLPGGVWSERITYYNARGWPTSVSELGFPDDKTSFLDYDPFGRARTIRPPDGDAHDIKLTFEGARRVTQEVMVAGPGGEVGVQSFRESDRHGRLRRVEEASGPESAYVPTTYHYDVGNRLTRVETAAGGENPVTQVRTYTYDNRGFLLAEGHPEKGTLGNGEVFYDGYDSAGLFHWIVDGPNELEHAYDLMGRLLTVRDTLQGSRPVVELEYDGAAGFGAGKLWRATRHNWVDLPWSPFGEENVTVQEIHAYEDPTGAVSSRTTWMSLPGEGSHSWIQTYGYDALGELTTLGYPTCLHGGCLSTVAPGRELSFRYDEGYLTEVPGWTGQLIYHANGAIAEIPHFNGVKDHQILDPSAPSRLGQSYTTDAWSRVPDNADNFNSGLYSYDGAGNIIGMGTDIFAYDPVSRLDEATVKDWKQSFDYDPFGNLVETTTTPPNQGSTTQTIAINASTNRLSAAGYDAAGSMTSWGPQLYTYDSLNRLTTLNNRWIYLYTAGGERIATIDWTGDVASRRMTFSLRDLSNQVISRFELLGDDQPGSWTRDRDYFYAAGRLLASEGPDGIRHYHLDHLGTPRLLTNEYGETLSDHDFLPYGTEITSPGSEVMKFTGHERDQNAPGSLDDLDYMHARFYTPRLGRFNRVDPLRGRVLQPGSLNRYAYVLGNPLTYRDRLGLESEECPDCPEIDGGEVTVIDSFFDFEEYLWYLNVFSLLYSAEEQFFRRLEVRMAALAEARQSRKDLQKEEESKEPPKRPCDIIDRVAHGIDGFFNLVAPVTVTVTAAHPRYLIAGSASVTAYADGSVSANGGAGIGFGVSGIGTSGRAFGGSHGKASGWGWKGAITFPIVPPFGFGATGIAAGEGQVAYGFGPAGGLAGSITYGYSGQIRQPTPLELEACE